MSIEIAWVQQRIAAAWAYCEIDPTVEDFRTAVIERTIEAVKRYRPDEDVEAYRAIVERCIDTRLAQEL